MLHPTVTVALTSRYVGETLAVADGMAYYLTECCQASAKGSEHGVVCRSCYRAIPEYLGDAAFLDDAAGMRRMVGRLVLGSEIDEALRTVEAVVA